MFVCSEPQFETWKPDFSSSGQPDPTWTRMLCGRTELCNSIGSVWCDDNPVQVRICEACGHIGCESGGYVHVSRLGDFVIWTAPQDGESPAYALETLGAIAFPAAVWEQRFVRAATLPPANHRAAAEAWFFAPGRVFDAAHLVPTLRAYLAGGDTLGKERAIEIVTTLLDELMANAAEPFTQRLADPRELGARIETLHFAEPYHPAWPALAFVGDTPHIAFTPELVAVGG